MTNSGVFRRERLTDPILAGKQIERPPRRCRVGLVVGYPIVLILMVLFVSAGCSDNRKAAHNQPDSVRTKDTSPAPPDTMLPPAPAATVSAPAAVTTWTYENRVEAAGDPVTHRASLTSPTRLQFGFPFTGGSTVRLGLRTRDGDALVSLHVQNGAFNKSFQGGTVRFRFDGGSAVTYRYAAAENGSATVIFLDRSDALIRKLKASRQLVVDLDFHNQGNRSFTFQTAGLRWPY